MKKALITTVALAVAALSGCAIYQQQLRTLIL